MSVEPLTDLQLTVFCHLQPLISLQCVHIMHVDINHNDNDTHDNHPSSLSFSRSQQAGAASSVLIHFRGLHRCTERVIETYIFLTSLVSLSTNTSMYILQEAGNA